MSLRIPRALFAAVLLLSLLVVPALPSSAATEVHYVPTALPDGTTELIRVEVNYDLSQGDSQPIIGSMSPYNLTPTGTGVGSSGYDGIASAQIDVLGTRGSTGCWDYGGYNEMQAGVDAIRFLAGDLPNENGDYLTWSNGNVGLTGVSYDGTTANMVASAPIEMWQTQGVDSIDADGTNPLKAIVPQAAISHWYGYAYGFGMRMVLDTESTSPTDEDILTPLAFDLGFGLTVHGDQVAREDVTDGAVRGCNTVKHTQDAYSRTPDYDEFWLERDYTVRADQWTTNTLVVHGWNDYNVKQYEATYLFEALDAHDTYLDGDGVEQTKFDLRMWMTQSQHASGNGAGYAPMLEAFWRTHLQGDETAAATLDSFPRVRTAGETRGTRNGMRGSRAEGPITLSNTWPLEGTETVSLFLNRTYEQDLPDNGVPVNVPGPGTGEVGELSYSNAPSGPLDGRSGSYGPTSGWLDTGLTGEELATNDPWSNDGQKLDTLGGQGYYSLHFATNPLHADTQIAGSAVLEGYFNYLPSTGASLMPLLVDVAPDDSMQIIQRGMLNLDYRNGLESNAGIASGNLRADVTFFPEDYTVPAGHRIGMILTSSNPQAAVPGNPAGFVSVLLGPNEGLTETGTVLHLPIVDPGTGPLFDDYVHPEA